MAQCLWAELDATVLEHGSDLIEKKSRKIDKQLRKLAAYDVVCSKITGFKASIPLISSLKNEAMRDRHWDRLKSVTGQASFDPGSKSMKLDAIFQMGLNQFEEEIEDIVGTAMQELKIEKEMAKIIETMGSCKFALIDYVKSGVKKGVKVLMPTDEIIQLVDDCTLNLQVRTNPSFLPLSHCLP